MATATPHPITAVRALAQQKGYGAALMWPLSRWVPALLPHSRRAARLMERLALEQPNARLSSLLSQLAAQTSGNARGGLPRVLVDRLASAMIATLNDTTAPKENASHPALAPLLARLLTLREKLLLQLRKEGGKPEDYAALARVTLELSPAAFFYSEGRGLEAVPHGLTLAITPIDAPLLWRPVRGPPGSTAMQLYATERAIDLVVEPLFDEEDRLLLMATSTRLVRLWQLPDGGVRITLPDNDAALAQALGLLPKDTDDRANTFVVHHKTRALHIIATLALRTDVTVAWGSAERTRVQAVHIGDVRIHGGEKNDWLNVKGGVTIDGSDAAALPALLEAIRSGKRYVVVSNDRILALSQAVIDALAPAAVAPSAPTFAAAMAAGVRFSEQLASHLRQMEARGAALEQGTLPDALQQQLRGYQVEGVRFLRRVAHWRTGGILADDMGLGKTRTTLAFLSERAALGPQLVVCPTSVMGAWAKEAQLIVPHVRMHNYGGDAKRKALLGQLGAGDVVVVSYGVLQRDMHTLSQVHFATAVFDEAQQLKNANSQRHRAAKLLNADVKLALSGTPLENHSGELWALFDVTSPGLFGDWATFRARFAVAIDKDDDAGRKRVLSRAIVPFVLRRKKEQVAKELPEKIEVDRVLVLSPGEARAYDDLRRALLIDLGQSDSDDDNEHGQTRAPIENRVRMLAALTRLRLCACHPGFASDVLVEVDAMEPGAKHHALLEILHTARANGERVLVFSQFVKHLRLAQSLASKHGLSSFVLVGDTPADERTRLVDAFQAGGADVFFISLKAGGFGLTLTRASTVVHLDPWWNPAVENQATDRAHRIGQTVPVTVVRLIAQGTLEETMLELHHKKRALVDAILNGTDQGARLSDAELLAMIRQTRRAPGDDTVALAD